MEGLLINEPDVINNTMSRELNSSAEPFYPRLSVPTIEDINNQVMVLKKESTVHRANNQVVPHKKANAPIQSMMIFTKNIKKIVKMNHGRATGYQRYKQVPFTYMLKVWCSADHSWTTPAGNLAEWCTICALTKSLRTVDRGIFCKQSDYSYGQIRFEFECSYGHEFITEMRSWRKGCKSCSLLEEARRNHQSGMSLTLDQKCLYIHDDTKLRFHCNKLLHNPSCDNLECITIAEGIMANTRNYAENCHNFIPCGQDFYASARQLRCTQGVYDCSNNHYCVLHHEAVLTIRVLEVTFDMRFDDDVYGTGIEFTAYNRELKIAAIHLADKIPQSRLQQARIWCDENRVLLVTIPAIKIKGSAVTNEIVSQLINLGVDFGTTVPVAVKNIRIKMHEMTQAMKLLKDRCI